MSTECSSEGLGKDIIGLDIMSITSILDCSSKIFTPLFPNFLGPGGMFHISYMGEQYTFFFQYCFHKLFTELLRRCL